MADFHQFLTISFREFTNIGAAHTRGWVGRAGDWEIPYMYIQHYLTLIGLLSTVCTNAKATPINNTNYSCHVTAVQVQYNLFNQSYGDYIMPHCATSY